MKLITMYNFLSFSNLGDYLFSQGVSILQKIAYCIFIIFLGSIGIKLSKTVISKLMARAAISTKIHSRKIPTLQSLLISISKYVIYFFVIFTVLVTFNVESSAILAFAGIGSVAVGFASQSLVKDFINGAFILLEDSYSVGDYVTLDGKYTGTVEAFGFRTTKIKTDSGDIFIIPNSDIRVIAVLAEKKS